jgi:hypothetical protein
MISTKSVITKDDILNKIKQEEIFEKYIGIYPDCKKNYLNPLRLDDNHASCRFYYDNRGILKFKDFAVRWNIDCFNVVQMIYNVNFIQACYIIAEDFDLKNKEIDRSLLEERKVIQRENLKKIKVKIQVKSRNFVKFDIEYWAKFGIDVIDLQYYNVFPVTHAWLGDDLIYIEKGTDVCYCYYFWGDNYKLYFPNRKKNSSYFRFIHNNQEIIQGYKQLDESGDYLVITKSLKDVIAMRRFGINAVAPMTETVMVNKPAFDHLITRFPIIFTLFDRDRAGKLLTIKHRKEYSTIPLMFTKDDEKDFTDNFARYGYSYMSDYIQETKNKFNL